MADVAERRTIEAPVAKRYYYSVRNGRQPPRPGLTLKEFLRVFLDAYRRLEADGAFHEWFGYSCVDDDHVKGKAGGDIELFVFRKLRRPDMWPIEDHLSTYSQDDLFDLIELLHDCSSKGVDGSFHSYANCGWHYSTYDKAAGQALYREAMNDILAELGEGFEVSERGEVSSLGDAGLRALLSAPLPEVDPENVGRRVEDAKRKFLRRGSSGSDRRDAVRDLADVLEFVRAEAKLVLRSDDERDLFNLANNFGIRHHRPGQKTDYDQAIWHSWMFYHCLATIQACTRLIAKSKEKQPGSARGDRAA